MNRLVTTLVAAALDQTEARDHLKTVRRVIDAKPYPKYEHAVLLREASLRVSEMEQRIKHP